MFTGLSCFTMVGTRTGRKFYWLFSFPSCSLEIFVFFVLALALAGLQRAGVLQGLCLDGRCKYMWRIIVLGAGRGCFPCPHILPKALSSFVVALAFAGL